MKKHSFIRHYEEFPNALYAKNKYEKQVKCRKWKLRDIKSFKRAIAFVLINGLIVMAAICSMFNIRTLKF